MPVICLIALIAFSAVMTFTPLFVEMMSREESDE